MSPWASDVEVVAIGFGEDLAQLLPEITVQRLEHAVCLQVTTALKVSGQPSHPAEGP
jgi:hypothetical protein